MRHGGPQISEGGDVAAGFQSRMYRQSCAAASPLSDAQQEVQVSGSQKERGNTSAPQKKQAPTANNATMPDGSTTKPFGKWRVPVHWVDETSRRSGTKYG